MQLLTGFSIFIVVKGPIHTFNGHKANFYITTGKGWCMNYPKNNATIDAEYFCSSFYGPNFDVISFEEGHYNDSTRMGYQLHRFTGCSSVGGPAIEKTDCPISSKTFKDVKLSQLSQNKDLYEVAAQKD